MYEKRKKSFDYEKVRFQFCSEGVERESGITQVHRERVPHGRRGVVDPRGPSVFVLVRGTYSSRSSLEDERMLSRSAKVEAGMH